MGFHCKGRSGGGGEHAPHDIMDAKAHAQVTAGYEDLERARRTVLLVPRRFCVEDRVKSQ